MAVGVTGEDQSGDTGTTGTTAATGTTSTAGAAPVSGIAQGDGSLVGRVTDGGGLPLTGLQVYLTRSDGSGLETSTSDTGQYVFANLRGGSYTVVAGDQRRTVTIGAHCSASEPEHADFTAAHEPS